MHSRLKVPYLGSGSKMQAKLRYIILFLFLFLTAADARAPVRPLEPAFKAMEKKNWDKAFLLADKDGDLGHYIILWHYLREGLGRPDQALNFLKQNSDWPGLPYLMKRSEKTFFNASDDQVLAFFEFGKPQTGLGSLVHALALKRDGQKFKAGLVAQAAWTDQSMNKATTVKIFENFRTSLLPLTDNRFEFLLWEKDKASLNAMSFLLSDIQKAVADTVFSLYANKKNVSSKINSLPTKWKKHPVVMHARFEWRLRNNLRDSALQVLKNYSKSARHLSQPSKWAERREILARDLMYNKQYTKAYNVSSNHYLEEGDTYAVLEWLSGYLALEKLNDAELALDHFKNFLVSVDAPISLGRGFYWLGRTYEKQGKMDVAQQIYQIGADRWETYYGLLAAEKVGRTVDVAVLNTSHSNHWRNASFSNGSVFKAALLLFSANQDVLAERFLTHLTETLSDEDILRLVDFLEENKKSHELVMVAKRAASQSKVFPRPYFALHPVADIPQRIPPEMTLAIARRESEFYPKVTSPVGALGMMQVMPKTAKEVAKRLGLKFSSEKMLSDWKYNAKIGIAYLEELSERYEGNPILMAVAYNAGPSRADRWIELLGDPRSPKIDLVQWVESIPFEETRNYVMRVSESLPNYQVRLNKNPPTSFNFYLKGSGLLPLAPESE
jgi:soluble lytic murein transglycosylase